MFDLSSVLTAFIFIFLGSVITLAVTYKKHKETKKLKELIAWSVSEYDDIRGNLPLWAYFKNAQNHISIHDKYRISENEWADAKGIITQYQKELTQLYFMDRSWLPVKSKYAVQSKDYFIFTLYTFLCDYKTYSNSLVHHKMHYITYMYCKSNLALQKCVPTWNESVLQEILDKILETTESHKAPILDAPGLKVNYRGRL